MDLIFRNGNVITMDATDSRASAIALKWGRIARVGHDDNIQQLAGPDTKVIDLEGKTVLPGFIDTHNHLSFYGYLVSSADCRAASGLESIEDLLQRLREEAAKTPAGQWVKGWGYAHYHLKEDRDITSIPAEQITHARVVMTVVGGRIVYEAAVSG